MATYGFGAAFGGSDDKTSDFIDSQAAYIGWNEQDAPFAHATLRQIEVGDLVFLKSFPPSIGLIVKAAGIVTDTTSLLRSDEFGVGVRVNWRFDCRNGGTKTFGKIGDKADFMRGGTLYREYNPSVQRQIVELILGN